MVTLYTNPYSSFWLNYHILEKHTVYRTEPLKKRSNTKYVFDSLYHIAKRDSRRTHTNPIWESPHLLPELHRNPAAWPAAVAASVTVFWRLAKSSLGKVTTNNTSKVVSIDKVIIMVLFPTHFPPHSVRIFIWNLSWFMMKWQSTKALAYLPLILPF